MKVNGIKTAVKAGELSPQDALKKLETLNKDTPYLTPHRTVRWLKKRGAQK